MTWAQIASGLSDILSLLLIVRLVFLRLHAAYRVFCAFLLLEIISQSFAFLDKYTPIRHLVDYRVAWLVLQVLFWILSIWMVYALLRAILEKLPGILRFSRRVLKIALPISILIALVTAGPEYVASGASIAKDPIDYFVLLGLILSRMVATVCVLILLATLLFILWFPVAMPRNLAIFSIGFAVYFTAKTFLLLFYNFWSHESRMLVSNIVAFILCICLAYWISFINRNGEFAQVTIGHSWRASKQTSLMKDLEGLNAVLSRSGRR
ncbi:MAG TPA: hypothetical protein VH477_15510 [Bryobacteraceae bacterium]|jgi:hypothetical protein